MLFVYYCNHDQTVFMPSKYGVPQGSLLGRTIRQLYLCIFVLYSNIDGTLQKTSFPALMVVDRNNLYIL